MKLKRIIAIFTIFILLLTVIPVTASGDDIVMIFSANDASALENVISKSNEGDISEYKDETNLYSKTAKVIIKKGGATGLKRYTDFNLAGMSYVNFWIYSPEVSSDNINYLLYTDQKNNKYTRYTEARSWQGWRLISIPLSKFAGAVAYDYLYINIGGWSETQSADGYILVDAIWGSKEKPTEMELVSSSIPDGYVGAADYGEILDFTFSGKLDPNSEPKVTVISEKGEKVTDYEVSVNGNIMTIIFAGLEPKTRYDVTVSEIVALEPVLCPDEETLSFTTGDGGLSLTDVTFDNATLSQGDNEITFSLLNTTGKDEDVILYAMAVGETEYTTSSVNKAIKLLAKDEVQTENITLTCPVGATEIKVFAVSSAGEILTRKYITLDAEGKKSTIVSTLNGEKSVKIKSAEIDINKVSVTASVAGVSNAILVTVTDEKENVVYQDIVNATNGEIVEKNFDFSENAKSGNYKISVSASGVADEETVSYLSKDDRESLLELANGKDKDMLADFIEVNAKVFGITGVSEEFYEEVAEFVLDEENFVDYKDAYDYITKIKDKFNSLNESGWATLAELILNNDKFFGGEDDTDFKYFKGLKEKNQNIICANIKLPTDCIERLNGAFEDAISDYKDSLDNNSGSGSVSGGGRKTSTVVGFTPSTETKKDVSVETHTPAETEDIFIDLGTVSWAKESVIKLYDKGIVSKADNNKFRPNDNITREEFVKLVVCAFADDVDLTEHRFTDEEEGAWYNQYLTKAYNAGISKGYADGSFGIGENISREDMVTICGRVLENMGNSMEDESDISFTDSELISDYAKTYVHFLVNMEVVKGMPDGSFAPKANATRAEAAKVIALLLDKK